MDPRLRKVTVLPLTELWRADGPIIPAERIQDLGVEEVRARLRDGPVQFVVADVADDLMWVELGDRFEFWKTEVEPHLADPNGIHPRPSEFPGSYFYWASDWGHTSVDGGRASIVLLEKAH